MSHNANTETQSGAGSADRTEEKPINAASILTQGAETAVSASSTPANANEPNDPEYLLSEFGLTAFNLSQLKRQPKERWLIHGVLPWADVALIYGPSRIGKSFVVIDIVMSLTRGQPFAGIATDRVAVLYIVTEGFKGTPKRIDAWQIHHAKPEDGPLVVVKGHVDLYSDKGVQNLIAFIRKLERVTGFDFKLIVIDTLAKAMGKAKENDNSDVTTVTVNVQRVVETFDCTILLVHHTGKDEGAGPRGASAWTGNVNASIEVKKGQGGARHLNLDKQKDEDDAVAFGFRLARYQVGEDDKGRPITSCVAIVEEIDPDRSEPDAGPSEVKQMLDLIKTAGTAGIAWSEVCKDSQFADMWKQRPATVRGWKKWLLDKGLVHEAGSSRKVRLYFGKKLEAAAAE